MFLPLHVDVPEDRRPWANWLFCGVLTVIYILTVKINYDLDWNIKFDEKKYEHLMLHGWNLRQMVTNIWLHADPLHLVGNLLFLWLFGNAVCAKVGNFKYILIYLGCGLISDSVCCMFSISPSLGASGAINGIIGMYLVFFPVNEIEGYWMLGYWYHRNSSTNAVPGYFIVPLWFAFDLYGAIFSNGQGIGYVAHVAGFAAGFMIAVVLMMTKIVVMARDEVSLFDYLKYGERGGAQMTVDSETEKMLLKRGVRLSGKYVVTDGTGSCDDEVEKPRKVRRRPAADDNGRVNNELLKDGCINLKCICGKRVKVLKKYQGKKCKCPQCNVVLNVPEVSS